MKKLLENLAVGLVIILSLVVIGLVIQYNVISSDGDTTREYDPEVAHSLHGEEVKEEKKTSYLDTLEGYEDVDVKVDPTTEGSAENIAVIKVETKKEGLVHTIGSAVENVEKKENYISNLEGYEEGAVKTAPAQAGADPDITPSEESTAGESEEENVSASTEEARPANDPLSDIMSDIDAIVDASE
ncbi:MAG: hypothetical protein JW682_05080 [Campylobacterales bacterium]|nr:hypothetical protein [Campylobacterales bacterium]HEO97788.1 hypothetical protein [Campylobacterota bacterium]